MSSCVELDGDLLNFPSKYIAHQCNCKSTNVSGLAKSIFEEFPWADITKFGPDVKKFESIDIRGNGQDERYVINMFSQIYPGKITEKSTSESDSSRKKAFLLCLKKILTIDDIESIAFPYRIGCGLAGGDWDFYRKSIYTFSKERDNLEVFIVRKYE